MLLLYWHFVQHRVAAFPAKMSVPDRGLNTTAAILHGIAPPAWTEAVAPAHGWDLAFAYAVSLLAWLHLLLPLASMLCGFGIALTGTAVDQPHPWQQGWCTVLPPPERFGGTNSP